MYSLRKTEHFPLICRQCRDLLQKCGERTLLAQEFDLNGSDIRYVCGSRQTLFDCRADFVCGIQHELLLVQVSRYTFE